MTAEMLRAKLDRAILAERWDAVKVIHERIAEFQREEAPNVIDLNERLPKKR